MRALQVTTHNSPPTFRDIPKPRPKAGEVLIKIHACGLNFADFLMINGTYQDCPKLPFTLGMEVAGEVVELGDELDGDDLGMPDIGQRVAVFTGSGGLAEYGCFPAHRCVILPDTMTYPEAAGFQIAYSTSHVALHHRAALQPGESLLVLGAAGGVGLTAVELGKLAGARVIAAARGTDKLAIAQKAGADYLINTQSDDLRDHVKSLGGADVVYDPVGGPLFTAALRACTPEARLLSIGFASGEVPQIAANHLLVKNISVIGLYWGGYLKFRPDIITDSLAYLVALYTDGKLSPHISKIVPFDQTLTALETLKSRRSTGKLVVAVP